MVELERTIMAKIIDLNDYKNITYEPARPPKFIKAYASKSRLMGVIGLRIHFEKMILFFHLDFEEYGFDRFQAYEGNDLQIIQQITKSFVGGLGANMTQISLEEASSLVYEAVRKGKSYYNDVPLEFFEYENWLIEKPSETSKCLYNKISTDCVNNYECMHYYFMRTVGHDLVIRDVLLSNRMTDFTLSQTPAMLLKNSIQQVGPETYICQSIMDYYDAYKLFVSEIEMKNKKVESINLLDSMPLSAKEASLQLNKKEFILVCYCEDVNRFKMDFEQLKPEHMINEHSGGDLYTIFNNNNHHVRNKNYFLNEDVHLITYVTQTNQVIFSCFKEKNLEHLKTDVSRNYNYLDILVELEATNPIVYRFVNSGAQDFLEFI